MARAVTDAAQGGMILLSEQAFQRTPLAALAPRLAVVAAGQHLLRCPNRDAPLLQSVWEVRPRPFSCSRSPDQVLCAAR